MLKKLFLASAILISMNLSANETAEEKCETVYSTCLEKCETLPEKDQESCNEKCDVEYSKCLEAIESK
jgi:hypothetical protein